MPVFFLSCLLSTRLLPHSSKWRDTAQSQMTCYMTWSNMQFRVTKTYQIGSFMTLSFPRKASCQKFIKTGCGDSSIDTKNLKLIWMRRRSTLTRLTTWSRGFFTIQQCKDSMMSFNRSEKNTKIYNRARHQWRLSLKHKTKMYVSNQRFLAKIRGTKRSLKSTGRRVFLEDKFLQLLNLCNSSHASCK